MAISSNTPGSVLERLRAMILAGEFGAGQRLKEEELARELTVSRTPIREALRALRAEGLVDLEKNRGATVKPYDVEDLDECYSLRALLEGYAARLAATRITEEQLERLERSMERIERFEPVGDMLDAVEQNLTFHGVIVEAAASPRLKGLLDSVTRVPPVYRSYYWYTPELRKISEQFHRWLINALRAGDAARAERVAIEHVLHAREVLLEHFFQSEQQRAQPPRRAPRKRNP